MFISQSKIVSKDGKSFLLRHAKADDKQALMDLNQTVHQDEGVARLVKDLFEGNCPGVGAEHFLVVVDEENDQIASSLVYLPNHLRYGGLELQVGIIELVGTMPDYRKRGFVRLMMEEAHRMSVVRGDHLRMILGIPHFYRQFGYGMALEADFSVKVRLADFLEASNGSDHSVILQEVKENDLDWITAFTDRETRREMISPAISKDLWRYELLEHDPKNVNRRDWYVLELDGIKAGLLSFKIEDQTAMVFYCELDSTKAEVSTITPSLLSALRSQFSFEALQLCLYSAHPLVKELSPWLEEAGLYSWYVDMPDLVSFLNSIQPVLEQRLANSPFFAYSGEIYLYTYRQKVRITIKHGTIFGNDLVDEINRKAPRLSVAEDMVPALFLGYRNLDEIRNCYPETYAVDFPKHLLEVLFPKGNAMVQMVI